MPKRIEFENVPDFQATAMIHEENEEFYRSVADRTVKPVISRLKEVYARARGRGRVVPWNHIMAVGMKLYHLHKEGYDINITIARELAKKFGTIPDDVLREIVQAVQAETVRARRR